METERLLIEPFRAADKEDYYLQIAHDRKVLASFICRYEDSLESFDFSPYLNNPALFAIRLKETGRVIGIILYFDERGDACEIGYAIGSRYWNQGYAGEAAGRFLDYLFTEKGFQTVHASFFAGNEASRRVMEKCGMRFRRFAEKELSYLGAERDLYYYSIRKEQRIAPETTL